MPPSDWCVIATASLSKSHADGFRIVRDDGVEDSVTRMRFGSYDDAYDELQRFYGDLCCSDERIEYAIQAVPDASAAAESSTAGREIE